VRAGWEVHHIGVAAGPAGAPPTLLGGRGGKLHVDMTATPTVAPPNRRAPAASCGRGLSKVLKDTSLREPAGMGLSSVGAVADCGLMCMRKHSVSLPCSCDGLWFIMHLCSDSYFFCPPPPFAHSPCRRDGQ
jgi:hypothetical protein